MDSYGLPGGPQVHYDAGDAYQDITDLYTVLPTEKPDGTKNLENAQVESLASRVLGGYPLSDVEIGTLIRLLAKYQPQIAELRATPGKDGQDYVGGVKPGTARLGVTS